MAPAPRQAAGRRNTTASPEAFHQLGVAGRKTGAMLKDTGTRDEHDMMPIDDMFSSSPAPQREATPEASDAGSEDMDIASSAGPGPQTLLKGRQFSIPRSRSPVKTNLRSPARKMRRDESPDNEVTTSRRIDFGAKTNGKGTNGHAYDDEEEEEEEDPEDFTPGEHPPTEDVINESLQALEDAEEEPEEEPEPEEFNFKTKGGAKKGRRAPEPIEEEPDVPQDDDDEEPELPPPKKRGRPAKGAKASPVARGKQTTAAAAAAGRKRPTPAFAPPPQGEETEEEDQRPAPKRAKAAPAKSTKPAAAAAAAAPKPATAPKAAPNMAKKRGRPSKVHEEDAGETSFMALQKGPPLPKSRGLVSVHHNDMDKTTRSGRHSIRPLAFWRGEAAVQERQAHHDHFRNDNADFIVPSYKEIVRVAEDTLPSKRAPRSKSRAKTKSSSSKTVIAQEEDEELEEWELNPGTMMGTVSLWQPEHELHPPGDDEEIAEDDEQIAISSDAIETREIKDATFRFAKTLTMPFMGAGVVDLPPGAEKRPKNSRKMHMVFFVHYGKVQVSVNETVFRISAGGTWFVPRGNYYRIVNDYDNPARLFFSQGCEVPAPQIEYEDEGAQQ